MWTRYKVLSSWRIFGCALVVWALGAGCSSAADRVPDRVYTSWESGGESGVQAEAEMAHDMGSTGSSRGSQFHDFSDTRVEGAPRSPAPTPSATPAQASSPATPVREAGAPPVDTSGGQQATSKSSAQGEAAVKKAPLLIYNGTVLLALYDVDETQKTIIELVEGEGGWVSSRSGNALVLRVPAARFRATLDQLAKMGDLLDLRWQAEDVTSTVRDTRIRLDSALKMRARLEELLAQAQDVRDALAIEQQLSRVILEIERLQATLRGYEERIAYSTINVEFRAKTKDEVPAQEYALPYYWLEELGVNRLLQIPRR